MNMLLWMLDDTTTTPKTENNPTIDKSVFGNFFKEYIWEYVEIVMYILIAVLAVVFIIKAITTALAVMKAADEPQVRQEKLASFKYLAIGLGVAIVVISLATVIVNLILSSGGNDTQVFLLK